jgi:hypothetical protein
VRAALVWWLAISTAVYAQVVPAADAVVREAVALARAGRLDEAASKLREGRTRYPEDARFPLELAGLAYRDKELRRARELLHSALRLKPQDSYGNEFLGSLYLLDANLPAALKYWNRVGKPVVGKVGFVPALRLDPVLLARLPAVSSGQVLTLRRLARTEAAMRDSGIFADMRFRLTPQTDQLYDFTIETEPREQAGGGRWWWRLLPYLRSVPYQAVNADVFNIGENATNVTSLWRWDPEKRRIAAEVSGPATTTVRYRLMVDARDERWDLRRTYQGDSDPLSGVVLRKAEAGGDAMFRIGDTARWVSGVFVSNREYRHGASDGGPLFAGGWLAEMRNRLEGTLAFWPERRMRVDGWAALRTGRFIGDDGVSRFVAPSAGVHAHWVPPARGEKYEVNVSARLGGVYGRAPLDEMYTLGMERDNPLWLRGHVGTRDGRKGNAPLGSQFLLVNSDVQRELWRVLFLRVQAGPFFDVGGTRDPENRFGSRGLLYDAGLQVTVRTLRGIRISAVYGRDLRDGRPAFYTAVIR